MGRVHIVGGATGIGRAALRAFRAEGQDVLLVDIDGEEGARACEEPGQGRVRFLRAGIADPEAPARAMGACVASFGGLGTPLVNATSSTRRRWRPRCSRTGRGAWPSTSRRPFFS